MFGAQHDYGSAPLTWVRSVVEDWTGYRVVTDPGPLSAGRVAHLDPGTRILSVVPGLSDIKWHSVVSRATLWVVGGDDWAPEWRGMRPRLYAAPEPVRMTLYPDRERYIAPGGA